MELKPHPLADLFPLMGDAELSTLAADIKEHGQREPIVIHEGMILDGRNRYRACKMAKVGPATVEWDGQGSAAAYVVSKNLHRRHLNASQRGMIAAKMADMKQGARTDIQENSRKSVSQSQAATLLQVNPKTVGDAKTVQTKGTADERKAVTEGKASVSTVANQIRSGMAAEERRKAREQKRPLKKPRKLSDVGKNPERIQRRQMNALIWRQVREALEHLTGLPKPSDVVSIVRGIPKAAPIVEERLARAANYLGELKDAWNAYEAA